MEKFVWPPQNIGTLKQSINYDIMLGKGLTHRINVQWWLQAAFIPNVVAIVLSIIYVGIRKGPLESLFHSVQSIFVFISFNLFSKGCS